MKMRMTKIWMTSAITIYALFTGLAAMAADTEIFFRDPPPDAPKPNVLFIMSTGGNMNGQISDVDGTNAPKIDVLKGILRDIVLTEDRINLGFMRFNNEGGPVAYPIVDLGTSVSPGLTTFGVEESSNDRVLSAGLLSVSEVIDSPNIEIGNANEVVAIRFPNVNIPQGATITSAQLLVTQSNTVDVLGTEQPRATVNDEVATSQVGIYIEDSADPAALDSGVIATPIALTRTLLAPVAWTIPGFTYAVGAENATHSSPDLSTHVQAIVNKAGWCGSHGINLFITSKTIATGIRTIKSADFVDAGGNVILDYAPRLVIEWDDASIDTGAGEGCYTNRVGRTIPNTDQDAEDVLDAGGVPVLSDDVADLDLFDNDATGAAGADSVAVGMIFPNLNVPNGATIQEAYIEFFPKDNNTTAFETNIKALSATNKTALADGFSTETKVLSTVQWDETNDPQADTGWIAGLSIHRSPDISGLVQSVVGQGGWQNDSVNNNLTLLLEGVSGTRRMLSSETANPPRVVVRYEGLYTGSTVRQEIVTVIDDYKLMNNQATVETYLEGYNYYTGKPVDFGTYRGSPVNTNHRVSHPDSYSSGIVTYNGKKRTVEELRIVCQTNPNDSECVSEQIIADGGTPTYIRPPMGQCQKNHIILLSDGPPSPIPNTSVAKVNTATGIGNCAGNDTEACGVDIATFLATTDQNISLDSEQVINSHYIHFGNDIDQDTRFPKAVAEAGDGLYRLAQNGAELKVAFNQIIDSLAAVNTSFVSAGITVNQSNRLTHRDELYFSLFRPEGFAHWPGNVKRYRIFGSTILDSNDAPAIVPNEDVFSKSAQSYWSPDADGNDASKGGAASQLDFSASSRVVFSNLTGNTGISPQDVADDDNLLTTVNSTPGVVGDTWENLLGTPDASTSEAVLSWIMGFDVDVAADGTLNITSDMHHAVGDPLHSKPTILTYRHTAAGVTSEFDMVFVGTNHGFLHGFYTDNGEEEWSFVPKELLNNVQDYMFNPERDPAVHEYGVDGSISIYIDDLNGDGAVDVADGEKAYLYVGLRRGGSAYYAFDITDHDDPELMFVINDPNPGTAGDDYDGLGQTWSRPVIAKLADESSTLVDASGKKYRLAMMFGGGYDTNQDPTDADPDGGAPSVDSFGNNVFIADAVTGAKIWDARTDAIQNSDAGSITLMNSVAADIKAIDPRTPGYIEHIYATDTAGQIFRFDFDVDWDGADAATLAKGGMFAEVQTAADGTSCTTVDCNRRFFYAPDIAIVPRPRGLSFVSVAMGTGYRAHPLGEEITDHFYGIRDMGVLVRETATDVNGDIYQTGFSIFDNRDGALSPDDSADEVIRLSNLVDITNLSTGSDALDSIENYDKAGWYLELDEGEKVLAESLTFNNRVIFTTYVPPAEDYSDCAPAQGSGRAYAVNVVDGTPVGDINNDGTIDGRDRFIDLNNIGIPPEPQVIVLGNGPQLLIGRQLATELIDVDWGEMDRIKWRERKRR